MARSDITVTVKATDMEEVRQIIREAERRAAEAVAAERERIVRELWGISLPAGPNFAWVEGHRPFIEAAIAIVRGEQP